MIAAELCRACYRLCGCTTPAGVITSVTNEMLLVFRTSFPMSSTWASRGFHARVRRGELYDGREGPSRSEPDAMATERCYDAMLKITMAMELWHDVMAKIAMVMERCC